MARIRVTIGAMPPLLRSLVEGALQDDPRVEIVGDASHRAPARTSPPIDVLVMSEEGLSSILPLQTDTDARSALGVVAIARNGIDAAVVQLSARHRRLEEPRQSLSEAIRDAAGLQRAAG
jgi:hypothetical protein